MTSQGHEKPRILVLSTGYLPLVGGSELALHHLTERMGDFEFDIVTGRLDDSPAQEQIGRSRVHRVGGRLHRVPFLLPKVLLPFALFKTAWRLARTNRYAMVHAYQASQAAGAGWLLSFVKPSLPFIVTLQEGKELDEQSWLVRFSRKLILRRARIVTAISMYLCQYAQRISAVPCVLIPNGVDAEHFGAVAIAKKEAMSEKLGLDGTEKVIISVSRLVEKNNIETLIRAFAKLSEDTVLVLVGDGPRRPRLMRLADDLGVYERTRFVGTVPHDELPAYLSVADLFARPSRSEGLGTAFLEAMAAGLPIVASPVGGIPDIVHDGLNGLLCEPDDIDGLAVCMTRILENETLAKQFSEHARETALDYDWENISARMGRVYRGLMKHE